MTSANGQTVLVFSDKDEITFTDLFLWDVKEPTPLFEKSRGRRPRWCGQPLRVVGLGRDGTLHGTYESRSCLFPVSRPVSRKACKKKITKKKKKQSSRHADVRLRASSRVPVPRTGELYFIAQRVSHKYKKRSASSCGNSIYIKNIDQPEHFQNSKV